MPSPSSRSYLSRRVLTRRDLLHRSLAAAAPIFIPARVFGGPGVPPANERVQIGIIGAGIRGRQLMRDMPAAGRIVAVCDCFLPRAHDAIRPGPAAAADAASDNAAESVLRGEELAKSATYADYRVMIDEGKLDAVVVTAPDHHHVRAAILACQAGLDVYCEKPLSLTVREGRKLVEAVRRHGRVLQVGSQQRSMEMDRFACEFVRKGGIGKVSQVEVQNWPGPLRYEGLPEEPMPDGMHWDLFCGPAPLRPYHWRLWQKDEREWDDRRWRGWDMWRDYSGHLMTNWGAHAVDLVQWALGMDDSGPVEIEPLVAGHSGEMRLCPVVARYASGVELRMTHAKGYNGGACFFGDLGRIVISRNKFTAIPRDLVTDPPDPQTAEIWKGKGIVARPHLENWLDCVKTRGEPVAPVEVGHRSVTVCHLAGIARELGRKLRWDPEKEVFPEDEEACALLDRPRRPGWELPG